VPHGDQNTKATGGSGTANGDLLHGIR